MKKILSLCLVIMLGHAVFAYEHTGGLRLDLNLELPEINGTMFQITSENNATLWYEGSFNRLFNIQLEGALVYDAAAGFAVGLDQKFAYLGIDNTFYPDIKNINLNGSTDLLSYKAGRFIMSDPSSLVFTHPVDGVDMNFVVGPSTFFAKAGYTGLVHFNASDVSMTGSDIVKGDSVFGAPRLVEELGWRQNEILDHYMNLGLTLTAQQDLLKDEDIVSGSEKLNSLYAQVNMDGVLHPVVLYDAGVVFQFGKYGDLSSNGFAGDLRFLFLPWESNSFISLKGLVSSGEKWENRQDYYGQGATGDQKQFVPISATATQGYVEEFEVGNITSFELLFNFSRKKSYATQISTTTLLRTVNGPVSSSLIADDGTESLFIGQEALVSFLFRPASDFGASIKTGVLFPGESIQINEMLEDYLAVLFKIGFDLSFSF